MRLIDSKECSHDRWHGSRPDKCSHPDCARAEIEDWPSVDKPCYCDKFEWEYIYQNHKVGWNLLAEMMLMP